MDWWGIDGGWGIDEGKWTVVKKLVLKHCMPETQSEITCNFTVTNVKKEHLPYYRSITITL